MARMSTTARSRIAVRLVIAALVAWFVITQITDWPLEITIAGIVAIAIGTAVLDRRVR